MHAFCNLDKWNALPKNYQAIVANAAANANSWMAARYDMQNPGGVEAAGRRRHAAASLHQ